MCISIQSKWRGNRNDVQLTNVEFNRQIFLSTNRTSHAHSSRCSRSPGIETVVRLDHRSDDGWNCESEEKCDLHRHAHTHTPTHSDQTERKKNMSFWMESNATEYMARSKCTLASEQTETWPMLLVGCSYWLILCVGECVMCVVFRSSAISIHFSEKKKTKKSKQHSQH